MKKNKKKSKKKKILLKRKDVMKIYNLINTKDIEKTKESIKTLDKIFDHELKTIFEIRVIPKKKCPIGCATKNFIFIHPDTVEGKYRKIAHLKEIIPKEMTHYFAVVMHEYQHVRQSVEELFPIGTSKERLEFDADEFVRRIINIIIS